MKAHARSLTREPSYPGDRVTVTITTAAGYALGQEPARYIRAVAVCSGGTMANALLYEDEGDRPYGFQDAPFDRATAAHLAFRRMVRGYKAALADTPKHMPVFVWDHVTRACADTTIERMKRRTIVPDLPVKRLPTPTD